MDLLEKNLTHMPAMRGLYKELESELYPVESTRKGDYTVKLNNIYLHSKYDPWKEAERIASVLLTDKDELDVIIIFGAGLGYIARILYDRLLKDNKSSTRPYIVYVEADMKIFASSLAVFDWSEMISDPNFKTFLEPEKDQLGGFIQSVPTKRLRYYYHRPSYPAYSDRYKVLQNHVAYVLDRKDMNNATFARFQKLWTKNVLLNLPGFLQSNRINSMKGIGRGMTSIVVAGGPNLEKSLDYLREQQHSALIIAVDTVYKYLKRHGIKSDIIVSIDPQFWNFKYLEDVSLDREIIVTDSSVYHKTFQVAPVERYFTANSIFSIADYFSPNVDRGTLAAGGSVATTAFDVARILGSTEIVLIGLDLSYPNRMTHFKGAFFETNFLTFSNYTNSAELNSYNYLAHADLKVVESTQGQVYSDSKMVIFRRWFDREVPLTEAQVFSPNLGGAKIEGAKIVELAALPRPTGSKEGYLAAIEQITAGSREMNRDEIGKKAVSFLCATREIARYCSKIVKFISEDGRISPKNIPLVKTAEHELMSDPFRAQVSNIISSSAQDIIISIMENMKFDSEDEKSVWKKTRLLYNSIYELTDFFEKYLNKLLNFMDLETKI